MIVYVDIDETICNTPASRDYSESTPIKGNINKINKMFGEGHTIVYWTARGSATGKDYCKITREQLKKWGVKFHQLKFKKPMYDLFICDKAINSIEFFK
jgi:hypothetical protein